MTRARFEPTVRYKKENPRFLRDLDAQICGELVLFILNNFLIAPFPSSLELAGTLSARYILQRQQWFIEQRAFGHPRFLRDLDAQIL